MPKQESVQRFDVSRMDSVTEQADGSLLCSAVFTTHGVFEYVDEETGRTVRELRPPEVVYDPVSMDTLRLRPLTNDHPPDMVYPHNVRDYQVGSLGDSIERVDAGIGGKMSVVEETALEDVRNGKHQLSCGYWSKVVQELIVPVEDGRTEVVYSAPGVWTDPATGVEHKYDAIQSEVVYNHCSIVHEGRAGPTVRMTLDAKAGVPRRVRFDRAHQIGAERMTTKHKDAGPDDSAAAGETVTIRGRTFNNVAPDLATAIALLIPDDTAEPSADEETEEEAPKAPDEEKPTLDSATAAKLDVLSAENARLKAELAKKDSKKKAAEDAAKFDAAVDARVQLRADASAYFDSPQDWSGKSDAQIKLAALQEAGGGLKLDSLDLDKKEDREYLDHAWRFSQELRENTDSTVDLRQAIAGAPKTDAAPLDSRAKKDAAWADGPPKLSRSR